MIRKSNISYMIDLHYRIHQVVHCNHMMLQYKDLLLCGRSLFLRDTTQEYGIKKNIALYSRYYRC